MCGKSLNKKVLLRRCSAGNSDGAVCKKFRHKLSGLLLKSQTERTRLETTEVRRELIPEADFRADLAAFQRIIDAALDGLAPALAADLAGLTNATAISDRL